MTERYHPCKRCDKFHLPHNMEEGVCRRCLWHKEEEPEIPNSFSVFEAYAQMFEAMKKMMGL